MERVAPDPLVLVPAPDAVALPVDAPEAGSPLSKPSGDVVVLAPAKTWAESNRWVAFLPALLVYPLWLYTMANTGSFREAFTDYWPATVGMVLGSFIAGSTPLGGGVVAFPLAVLVFEFSSPESRDASVLVQSVGMNSAGFLLFVQKPHLLNSEIICLSSMFASFGVVWGVAQPVDPFLVNLTYAVFISVFALMYWFSKRTKDEVEKAQDNARDAVSEPAMRALQAVVANPTFPFASQDVMGPLGRGALRDGVLFASLGAMSILGGYVTAMVGSGADMAVYIFGVFVWNKLAPERHMSDTEFTASSVVVMGVMSAYTVVLRVLNGGFTHRVQMCWGAMAAIVCLGAPLGSAVLKPSAEPFLRGVFYVLAFVQFVSFAVLKIRGNVTAWIVIAVIFTVELSVLWWLDKRKTCEQGAAKDPAVLDALTAEATGPRPVNAATPRDGSVDVVVLGDVMPAAHGTPGRYRASNVVVGRPKRKRKRRKPGGLHVPAAGGHTVDVLALPTLSDSSLVSPHVGGGGHGALGADLAAAAATDVPIAEAPLRSQFAADSLELAVLE